MFGEQPFADSLLRWLSVPLFRVGLLLVGVPIVVRGHATWVSTVGVGLLAVSFIAVTRNLVVMRWRAASHGGSPRAR
jgi:hypothetical protein